MVHRVGVVPVGESSIVIVVAAPHRKAALDAVHFAIDSVKALVPIWKKEVYAGAFVEGQGEEEGEEWTEEDGEEEEIMPAGHVAEAVATRGDRDLADAKMKEKDELGDLPPPCPQWKVNKEWDRTRAVEFSQGASRPDA